MKLLAVETSTDACSVALSIEGVITEQFELTPKTHTKLILPMIDVLMRDAGLRPQELDALAFSCGPGSFTGVRIATGIIQGIAFGADLPVVRVSTLAAVAQNYFDQPCAKESVAFIAMDARIGEIFWGVYQKDAAGLAELIGKEAVILATDIEFPALKGAGIGSGWGVYANELQSRLAGYVNSYDVGQNPRASTIVRLGIRDYNKGLAVTVEQAMPVYLRDKVAQTEAERKQSK